MPMIAPLTYDGPMTPPTAMDEPTALSPGPHRDLVGDGLVLRPWELPHAPLLVEVSQDPLIATWNTLNATTLEAAQAWITKVQEWTNFATFAVHDAESHAILGSISLFHLDAANLSGEIGYWVAPAVRGQGVAGRAIETVSRFAFDDLGVVRVELYHAVENERSCPAASKARFSLEGTLRQSYRYSDGNLHDEHLHARLRTD